MPVEGPGSSVASHRIAAHVRDRILDGTLAPGARVRQDELARELGASRLPVREALHILQSAGLVTLEANRGAWVSRLEKGDCELSYEIRERLEPLLLRLSLPGLTADDIAELEEIQDEIEAGRDVERFLVLDRRLHWVTYRGASDAGHLAAMVGRLWDTTHHYRRAFTYLAGQQRRWIINAEHRLLIEAVRDGDVVEAERVLAMHIRRTRVQLGEHPEVFLPGADITAPGGATR